MLQDPRLRLAFLITIFMSGLIIVVTQGRNEDDALPMVVALVVVMSVLQMAVLFLWSGSPRTRLVAARRYFMLGEFDKAITLLETLVDESPSADAFALLGNTYRQQKNIEQSKAALTKGLALEPENKLALFGMGKSLMIEGDYEAAATYITRALQQGGRKTIRADLAQALYYAGRATDEVRRVSRQAARVLNLEQHRTLFVNYLLYNLANEEKETAKRMIHNTAQGLAFWQAEARRFADYDYGRRVAGDVVEMKAILEGENSTDV